jgi:hypothetical protein
MKVTRLIYKDSVRTSQKTHCLVYKQNQSVHAVWGKIAVCSEIHTKHTNALCGQNVQFFNVKPGGT